MTDVELSSTGDRTSDHAHEGPRRRRFVWVAVTLLAAAALVAIGLWAIAADDGGSTTAAGAAPSDDALTVVGDAACSWSMVGEDVVEGVTIIEERFECQLDVSDTRVSGTEVVDVTTRIDDWARGGTWTADGVITSEDGTWRGAGHGVVSTVGNLPFSPQQSPVNFGEMHYEGDDAFEGLTFHYYVAGTNSALGISGWIEGS